MGMSAASLSMPLVAGTLSLGAVIAGLASLPSVRELLAHYLGDGATRHAWKLAALAFALANFKNLPGIWHLRVFRGILYQIYFQPTQQPPKHLFAPIITSSRNTPWDTDYNLHKSNSTYFADLDIGRAHAMGLIIRTGLSRLNKGDEEGLTEDIRNMKGSYNVALGARLNRSKLSRSGQGYYPGTASGCISSPMWSRRALSSLTRTSCNRGRRVRRRPQRPRKTRRISLSISSPRVSRDTSLRKAD